jgi:hypothetical protein
VFDYGLDGRGVGVRVPVVATFSPLHVVWTGSGAHQASYPTGIGGNASVVKELGPGSRLHPLPPYILMA